MTTTRKRCLLAAAAAVLLAAVLAAFYFYIPEASRPSLGEGNLLAYLEEDGSVILSWPVSETEGAAYLLRVRSGGERYEEHCVRPTATLSGFALPLEVQIQAVSAGKNLLGLERELVSRKKLEVEVAGFSDSPPAMTGSAGAGTLELAWDAEDGTLYEVSVLEENGQYTPLASTGEGALSLRFGEDGGLPIPSYGHPLRLVLRAGRQEKDCCLYGPASVPMTVERNELLGNELSFTFEVAGPRTYTLRWSETKGDYYMLQEWKNGGWQSLERLDPSAESMTYELGMLGSGSHHLYQLVARDNDGTEHASEQVSFYVDISTLYNTIWPILDLAYYESPGASASLGKIPAGTALCVLEEDGQWFQVRYKDRYVYVDSRYCMINLAEYIGDYCSYDITNSYESIFKVHTSPIAKITGQVISGFENMRTSEGAFLVPFLYPCAQKLLAAAKAAMADGYRLKIYESFRPNQATRYLYDTTAAQLSYPALVVDSQGYAVDPQSGWRVELSSGLLVNPATGAKVRPETVWVPEPSAEPPEAPAEELEETPSVPLAEAPEAAGLDEDGLQEPAASAPAPKKVSAYDSYSKIMTNNGQFGLGSFLARVTSAHNRGIALDLTLETLEGGEELEMQSAMHDLSWYSATSRNNENAKLLESYMTATGMRGLSSEWWHFQDDETREAIGLDAYLSKGVSAAGWTRDAQGWRYRNADGSFAAGQTITVDGKSYTLDANGYAVE